ncbi:MAG TPA: cytochrome c oxidase assembly protein [Caulobacteraceae bacterium]|nr:cytochrome c oxidase assembly protein [Caulobacteraceae bacterium]
MPAWARWDFSLDIIAPAALVVAIYWRGLERRPGAFDAHPLRHLLFLGGVSITFLSLASPLDALADRLFSVHQVQHILLRVVGPMLIALAKPHATLLAGLPGWLRRRVSAPIAGSRAVGAVFGALAKPAVSTLLFVASLYVWQWPAFHNRAILDDGVHEAMHVTMLAAGLLFFWRLFDQRRPPKGLGFGARLMMLWVAVLANIPIGAYTCFKSRELYWAYDAARLSLGVSAMDDERLGGFIMWAPASMMMLIAVLIVVHAWGGHEEREERRRAAALSAGAPAAVASMPGPVELGRKNRAFAYGLAAFSVSVLAATLTVAFLVLHHLAPAAPALALDTARVGVATSLKP